MSGEDANHGIEAKNPRKFRVQVQNVKNWWTGTLKSEVKRINGFPWELHVWHHKSLRRFLNVQLVCLKSMESEVWDCEVVGEAKLINPVDDSETLMLDIHEIFHMNRNSHTVLDFEHLDNILTNESFIVDGSITIEAIVYVRGRSGDRFRKKPQAYDFLTPSKFSDVILAVEGQKLHLSKQILANASPYFEALFSHEFKESQEKEIIMNDVSVEDFLTALKLVYDIGSVDDTNVQSLLVIADRFHIPKVMISCEQWLTSYSSELPRHLKLLFSDQYSLHELLGCCLEHIYDPSSASEVTDSESYQHFSSGLKEEIRKWTIEVETWDIELLNFKIKSIKERDRSQKMSQTDFFTSSKFFFDVVFVVQGTKIHAGKQILAHASTYCENLFYVDLEESEEKEIVIDDMSPEEFVVALGMVYNTLLKVDDENVQCMLKMADRFKIMGLLDRAEKWLIKGSALPLHLKLRFAEQYDALEVLKRSCLREISDHSQVSELLNSDSYSLYSSELKDELIKKLIQLCEENDA